MPPSRSTRMWMTCGYLVDLAACHPHVLWKGVDNRYFPSPLSGYPQFRVSLESRHFPSKIFPQMCTQTVDKKWSENQWITMSSANISLKRRLKVYARHIFLSKMNRYQLKMSTLNRLYPQMDPRQWIDRHLLKHPIPVPAFLQKRQVTAPPW